MLAFAVEKAGFQAALAAAFHIRGERVADDHDFRWCGGIFASMDERFVQLLDTSGKKGFGGFGNADPLGNEKVAEKRIHPCFFQAVALLFVGTVAGGAEEVTLMEVCQHFHGAVYGNGAVKESFYELIFKADAVEVDVQRF